MVRRIVQKDISQVGKRAANEIGIYDMSGNVHEWCWEWYDWSYFKECAKTGTINDPTGPDSGSKRVCRGGSAHDAEKFSLVSKRGSMDADFKSDTIGMRVVRRAR